MKYDYNAKKVTKSTSCDMVRNIKNGILFLAFTLNSCISHGQEQIYDAGSHFESGFARLIQSGPEDQDALGKSSSSGVDFEVLNREFYIDTTGEVAFNTVLHGSFYSGKEVKDYYCKLDPAQLPEQYYVEVKKGNKLGILTSDGHWLLEPIYEQIDTRNTNLWRVEKEGLQNLFTRKGFLLPFQFEQVYQLTEPYYNVAKDGRWGVYNQKEKRMEIPLEYQELDYCYGCEAKGNYLFAKKAGKWGVIDFQNKVLLPFEYEHEHAHMRSDEMILSLYKNGEQLWINLKTKEELPYKAHLEKTVDMPDTVVVAQGFMRIEKQEKYGLIDPKGKEILPMRYDYIRYNGDTSPYSNDFPLPYVAINEQGHWGVADSTGKILIEPEYTSIDMVADQYFLATKEQQKFLMDRNGQKLLEQGYDNISVEGVACACDDKQLTFFTLMDQNRYGLFNPQTNVFLSPQFDQLYTYDIIGGLPHVVEVVAGNKKGVLDVDSGEMVLKPTYDSYDDTATPEGYWIVREGAQYGLYNYQERKQAFPAQYESLYGLNKGDLLLMSIDGKYGLVDVKGKVVVPAQYGQISPLSNSLYLLTTPEASYPNPYAFYNQTKKKIYAPSYDSVETVYSDQLAVLRDQGRYKLYNPLKDQIIKGAYSKGGFPSYMDKFYRHQAVIKKGDKAAIIDEKGNYVIPPQYHSISSLHQGYALMFSEEQDYFGAPYYGYIDSLGKVVVPARYVFDSQKDLADYFKGDYLLLLGEEEDNRQPVGLANRSGKVIIPPEYDQLIFQENGSHFLVKREERFGILDADGKVILPVQFEDIILDEKPILTTDYKFSFPVLAKKNGIYQYYKKDGSTLSIQTKRPIPFDNFFGN